MDTFQRRTFFEAVHYRIYNQKVIDSPGIREMLNEVRPHMEADLELKENFAKIEAIQQRGRQAI